MGGGEELTPKTLPCVHHLSCRSNLFSGMEFDVNSMIKKSFYSRNYIEKLEIVDRGCNCINPVVGNCLPYLKVW